MGGRGSKICRLLGLLAALVISPLLAKDIVVVQVADFSASRAVLGKAMNAGAKAWFDHVNAQGGVSGNKIKFIAHDDQYKVEETLRLVRESLQKDRPTAFLGILGTANTGELLKHAVLTDAATPLIAPYTGADHLRTPFNAYVFHIRASYGDEIEKMVDQFARTGFKRLAVFYENDAFGQAGLAAFDASTKKRNLDSGIRAVVERGAKDLNAAIEVLKAKQPEGIVMATAGSVSANFLRDLRAAGIHVPVMGYSVNDYANIVKVAGLESARGTGFTQVMPDPAYCYRPVCREFKRVYAQYGPKDLPANPNTVEGFIAARVLTEGLRRAGAGASGQVLMKALEGLRDYDLGDFIIGYSQASRAGSKYIDIGVLSKDGTLRY
ncbi:Leu/Ile/Val-binding protein [Burkholderiales bacterium]|nr:Leu/Ile/Val-binding protein [Burkholderiales bacterium]